jgi:RNA polymerase sigma factor (sigma-70 family)
MSTALLTRSTARDRAFERLYRRHVHDVYRYVLAVLRNQADAEDATQATFLSAFRAFDRGEEPQKPRNWLLKIAHNECRQRFRAAARRPREVEWDERTPAPPLDETVPTADEIRRALAHLSFNQRSALVMRELEGRSYAEIGEILDLTGSAVETVLFRARRALREQLEGALSCGEAEAALSRRIDGRLAAPEQRALRAHLRECPECAVLERKQRARRAAVKRLGIVHLPPSLASFLGGGGGSVSGGAIAGAGSGLAAKAAAVVAAGVVAGSAAHQAVEAVTPASPNRTAQSEPRQAQRQLAASPSAAAARPRGGVPVRQKTERRSRAAPAASTGRVRQAVKAALGRRRSADSVGAPAAAPAPGSATAGPPAASPSTPAPGPGSPSTPVSPPAAPVPLPSVPTPPLPVPVNVPPTPPTPPLPVEVPPVPPLPPLPPLPPVLPPPPPLLPPPPPLLPPPPPPPGP